MIRDENIANIEHDANTSAEKMETMMKNAQ